MCVTTPGLASVRDYKVAYTHARFDLGTKGETMAPVVRQWLSVYDDTNLTMHGRTVWARDVPMDFLPIKGDKIMLWPPAGELQIGPLWVPLDPFVEPSWPVLERHFTARGRADLVLVSMYVDPDENELKPRQVMRDGKGAPWWTASRPDLEVNLPRGGWVVV